MAETSQPSKSDVAAIFKRLRSLPSNKVCFDCGAKNPTWASVTYGVFICFDCSAVHRSLGVHISFVRSTQLDTNWNWLQLRAMQVGGNVNAQSFFQQHNCSTSDTQQKYNSRAAQLYREKLHHMAAAAMRIHGTKVHIDNIHTESQSPTDAQEVDFFLEHSEASLAPKSSLEMTDGSASLLSAPAIQIKSSVNEELNISPNLSSTISKETQSQEPRKSTIGVRKPASARKGLGTKKGLGAQKVTTDFGQLEKAAQQADQMREAAPTSTQKTNETPEEESNQLRSVRLAYQDLSIKENEIKSRLEQVDPKKAQQLERLGMGATNSKFLSSTGVSHSALSDMKTIPQDIPSSMKSKDRDRDADDDFEFFGFTAGPPKYRDSPFSSRREDTFGGGDLDDLEKPKRSTSSTFSETILPVESEGSSRTRKAVVTSPDSSRNEAQKKFGNAKAISSDQYFGGSRDLELEHRANLSRFQGSSGISSEDFFGYGSQKQQSTSYNTPNLYDIKEGVRDGVTKVAGRLSSLANGVMTSLQEKYGY